MILRLWSGWTTGEGAVAYDAVLNDEVAPGIAERQLPGLSRFEVWTRSGLDGPPSEQEFLTAMWFDDVDSVAEFTGGDPRHSVVPHAARAVLARFDHQSRHYELRRRHI